MRLVLVTYYGRREALEYGARALEECGARVADFPLYRYSVDACDKRTDYEELLSEAIKEHQAEVVLFWCLAIDSARLAKLRARHLNTLFALFNWDDPYCWHVAANEMPNKAACFDVVFPSSQHGCDLYRQHGTKVAQFLAPAFNPELHCPLIDPNFHCDVSLVATALYDNPEALISRKALCDALEAAEDIDFHLYGPEHFQQSYPRSYRGWASIENNVKVFSNSRINLCTHVINAKGYINERCVLIAGAGGLLLVDPVQGFENLFEPNTECIFLNTESINAAVAQIRELLLRPEEELSSIRAAARLRALRDYSFASWAEKIMFTLRQFLEKTSCDQVYSLDSAGLAVE